ncbi:MAG: macro domain-containing protein [Lachnospiraceae bacterium]|nr:macro domain-containing protein [Lachnospiraceae bacterium]
MPFQIIRNDITQVKADAIVNSANPKPQFGSGVDAAIYRAAGEERLLAEREKIGEMEPGEVAVTSAFDLKAKYIIHTVGPVWDGGGAGEFDVLHNCYRRSLDMALKLECESVAFPLIASGVYGFPKAEALQIAMQEISSFLMRDGVDMTVTLVVFDNSAFRLSNSLFSEVSSFIDDEGVKAAHRKEYEITGANSVSRIVRRAARAHMTNDFAALEPEAYVGAFNEMTFQKSLYMRDDKDEMSFQNHLMKLIIEKDMDNTTVYKRSNVTKGAFSKILCGDTKKPQKKTVLGFCIGLRLNLEEAKGLLASADMAFNPYDKRDKLVIQCILHGQYNIDEVNAMLFVCDQPLLGN